MPDIPYCLRGCTFNKHVPKSIIIKVLTNRMNCCHRDKSQTSILVAPKEREETLVQCKNKIVSHFCI